MKIKCFLIGVFIFTLCGCSIQKDDIEKLRDVEFTVVDPHKIPEELLQHIEGVKAEPFEITYGDEGYLYIAKGYGEKDTSGYSIEVDECYETTNTICMKSSLLGPQKEEDMVEQPTFPYIVIKTEYSEKCVVFQ